MLKIDRRPGEKLHCRGKVHGTFTVQLCDKEMRGIYNTSVVVRLERLRYSCLHIATSGASTGKLK